MKLLEKPKELKMSSKIPYIIDFLLNSNFHFEHSGDIGRGCVFLEFELFARDYIKFAEIELDKGTPVSLINCVGHLKRALECQIDTFFFTFNLHKLFKKRNLGIDKKLEFINKAGIFNSRSLNRLNLIRNNMEHKYEIPKIKELDVFYDLVLALIVVLENVSIVFHSGIISYFDLKDANDNTVGKFTSEYEHEDPKFSFSWIVNEEKTEFIIDFSEPQEFAKAFKIHLLLQQNEGFASSEFIKDELQLIEIPLK